MMCRDSNEWGIPSLPKYLHCKTPCCKNGQFLSCFCGGIVCCSGPCQKRGRFAVLPVTKVYKSVTKVSLFPGFGWMAEWPQRIVRFFQTLALGTLRISWCVSRNGEEWGKSPGRRNRIGGRIGACWVMLVVGVVRHVCITYHTVHACIFNYIYIIIYIWLYLYIYIYYTHITCIWYRIMFIYIYINLLHVEHMNRLMYSAPSLVGVSCFEP